VFVLIVIQACFSIGHPQFNLLNLRALNVHELYMHRCIDLAQLGAGSVAPNPMVGALLVHENRVIGEGYHQQYGQAHAEVNCIRSVAEADRALVAASVLYVSLEPCAHTGKTPPCSDLIISSGIRHVVIGTRDPFSEVNGKGIEKLITAGINVETGVLQLECRELNKRFFTFHMQHRPYIILKWAQTANGIIGSDAGERLLISNEYSNRLVHRWRSEEAAILVGTQTALHDNPALTTRLWKGRNPVRLVVDRQLRLPLSLRLFDRSVKTIVFNNKIHAEEPNRLYYQLPGNNPFISSLLQALYQLGIQSVLVEGGGKLLQSFIDENAWDEARIITNSLMQADTGVPAPRLKDVQLVETEQLQNDTITIYRSVAHQ
jgi:diaminohydroxyphosphoribosylaminopyrimidine deaminase / 5-amino-6-(5-phosphoribosylamino)uracil reductase